VGLAGLACLGVAACGGGGGDGGVVVRIGDVAITQSTFSHWLAVTAHGSAVPEPPRYLACIADLEKGAAKSGAPASASAHAQLRAQCARHYQALKRQALGYLITSRWLIGEAAERRLSPSHPEIAAKEQGQFPNGTGELREFHEETGQTPADVRFTIEAELASAKLQHATQGGARAITDAEIAAYYAAHKHSFAVPERRSIEIVERSSEAAAREVRRELDSGTGIARLHPLHETFERSGEIATLDGEQIERTMFSVKPHVLVGPVRLSASYSVYEVTRIEPPTQRSLAQERASIDEQLLAEQQRQTSADFIKAWTQKWTARTDCQAGFIVPKCLQYKGPPEALPESLSVAVG
jgi:hypothetical protein